MSAAPFLPPGLEDMANAPLTEALRETILKEVERAVEARAEVLWAKGRAAFGQAQLQHREEVQRLTEKVSQCQEKHKLLAEENERLREALNAVEAKCSIVGCEAAHSPSTFAPTSPLHSDDMSSYPSRPFTPFAPGLDFYPEVLLPEVPPLPFAKPGTSPAPLSLAEALGPPIQRTPLSLAQSLAAQSDSQDGLRKSKTFHVTINKMADEELGLDVSHEEDGGSVLVVDGLRHGAVEAWNQQCLSSGQAEKAVHCGDKICECNGITGPKQMLEECVSQRKLYLSILREDVEWCQLRAEASEFVPGDQR